MVLGALIWGIMGDRIGRKPGLLYSILMYSLGTLASGMVNDPHLYAVARFFTGFGLAGELGAGVTLISERLSPSKRGYGITIFLCLGFVGVLLASLATEFIYWRHAYFIGGGAGLLLLLTRFALVESGFYLSAQNKTAKRGDLGGLLRNRKQLKIWICGILLVAPAVFVPQFLWTLSPEIAKLVGITAPVKVNVVFGIGYSCVVLGDLLAGILSEKLKSRKKAVIIFLAAGASVFSIYLICPPQNLTVFYLINGLLGVTFGVWVVGTTWVTEQIGTNRRATIATTVPNFARGLTIPMNLAYAQLKTIDPVMGIVMIGAVIFVLSAYAWYSLRETWGKTLDYVDGMG
jgi:MFS family permease